jgi:hypothetical protein
MPDIIRKLITGGFFNAASRERLNGVDVIKITSSTGYVPDALWVDARTYLPLQDVTIVRDAHGKVVGSEPTRYQVTVADLRLLTRRRILVPWFAPFPDRTTGAVRCSAAVSSAPSRLWTEAGRNLSTGCPRGADHDVRHGGSNDQVSGRPTRSSIVAFDGAGRTR